MSIKCFRFSTKTDSRCSVSRNRTNIGSLLSETSQSNSIKSIPSAESGSGDFMAWESQLTDEVRRVNGVTSLQVCPVKWAFENIQQRAVKSFSADCEMILTGTA